MADFIPVPSYNSAPPTAGGTRGNHNHDSRGNHGGRGRSRGGGRFGGGRGRGNRGGRGGGRGRGGRGRGGSDSAGRAFVDTSHIEEVMLSSSSPTPPNHIHDGATKKKGRSSSSSVLRMAVQGCLHGELDSVYETLLAYERQSSSNHQHSNKKIDVLVCCGDFQSLRNQGDLQGMAVPDKYKALGQFHAYYSGQKVAPILTLFVGGNHEASAYLQELPYGGWVAPNMYYMGLSNVLSLHISNNNKKTTTGIRVGGLSGIYKSHDYHMGRHECPPYDRSSLRSVYHVRHVDVYRLTCLSMHPSQTKKKKMQVMVSHDWPRGVEQHGDTEGLLRRKPFFRQEVQQNDLGSPAAETVLRSLQPNWWFAAHLHVKFTATIPHPPSTTTTTTTNDKPTPTSLQLVPSQVLVGASDQSLQPPPKQSQTEFRSVESRSCPSSGSVPDLTEQMTRFLSLDKCLPRRHFLQVISIPYDNDDDDNDDDEPCTRSDNDVKQEQDETNDDNVDYVGDDTEGRRRKIRLAYDLEWLTILKKTHALTSTARARVHVPDQPMPVTQEEMEELEARMIRKDTEEDGASSLWVPENFCKTAPPHGAPGANLHNVTLRNNPQTDAFLNMLELPHILTPPPPPPPPPQNAMANTSTIADADEIDIDDIMEDDDDDGDANETPPTKATADDENEIDLEEEDNDVESEVDLDHANTDVVASSCNTSLPNTSEASAIKKPRLEAP